MAVRFHKSINLGGGFRINLSKSGIGYSWGFKGYRVTKTARGTIRQTTSIPGTGISFVEETGLSHTTKPPVPQNNPVDNNVYDTKEFVNADASAIKSEGLKDILSLANRALSFNKNAMIGTVMFLFLGLLYPAFLTLAILCAVVKLYVKTAGIINLEYDIDEDQQDLVAKRINRMIRITGSNRVWRVMQTSKVIDRKYTSGAGHSVKRVSCLTSTTVPYPFKTNTTAAVFKSGIETLIFLPDKLFIIQGSKIGALGYNDILTSANTTQFIEDGAVPSDSKIMGQTWQYVNKNGGPDRRFKNNRTLPICLYGEIKLCSSLGLNTVIMFSNAGLK